MKYCAQCKVDLPDSSKFCRSCGGNLSEARTVIEPGPRCKNCGAAIQMDWKACGRCGHPTPSAASTVKMTAVEMTTVKMAAVQTCSGCSMTLDEGMKFCMGCGKAVAPAEKDQSPSEKDRGARLATTIIEKIVVPPIPLPPQPEAACRKCGTPARAGLKFCEKCGASITGIQPDKNRKILFIASGAGFALILLVAGWYLWGVSVTVISNQPDVQVFIDDKMVAGSSNGQRITISHVLRGQRTLRVKRDGFEDAVSTLRLGFGDFSKTIEISLTPYLYGLTITSVPAVCKVLVDGKDAGATDSSGQLTLKNIARGGHTLTVQRAGYQDWTQSVSLTSSLSVKAELTLAIGGAWQGSYGVSQSTPPSGFTLSITQTGASFTGRADQRDNNNTESNASLEGTVGGREIRYVKRYSNGGTAEYKGTVDASGLRAAGTWLSGAASGTWVMAKVEKADSGWIAPIYSKIDSLNADVTDLKFYEGGSEPPPQKRYSTRFSSASSRSIYYDLFLKYPIPGRRVEFETIAVYYNSDGTVLGRKTRQASIDASWNASNHFDGWGTVTAGSWKTGFYRVDIFVAGKRIASKWFEVY
ncbi:MAG: zinc ribbon domain-containing protein [Blastocatellia bacterium]